MLDCSLPARLSPCRSSRHQTSAWHGTKLVTDCGDLLTYLAEMPSFAYCWWMSDTTQIFSFESFYEHSLIAGGLHHSIRIESELDGLNFPIDLPCVFDWKFYFGPVTCEALSRWISALYQTAKCSQKTSFTLCVSCFWWLFATELSPNMSFLRSGDFWSYRTCSDALASVEDLKNSSGIILHGNFPKRSLDLQVCSRKALHGLKPLFLCVSSPWGVCFTRFIFRFSEQQARILGSSCFLAFHCFLQ